jgi:hypothetical protein
MRVGTAVNQFADPHIQTYKAYLAVGRSAHLDVVVGKAHSSTKCAVLLTDDVLAGGMYLLSKCDQDG